MLGLLTDGETVALDTGTTAEKLGRTALGRICDAEDIALVVTGARPGTPVVDELQTRGVKIVYASDS